jgi:hypothetical protein
MSDITMDLPSHDIQVFGKDLRIIPEKSEAVAQRLKIKLLFFKGEWFLNTEFGVPFYQRIFTKGITKGQVDNIFRNQILDTDGVLSIITFESTFNNSSRAYSLTFSCKVESGEIVTITI